VTPHPSLAEFGRGLSTFPVSRKFKNLDFPCLGRPNTAILKVGFSKILKNINQVKKFFIFIELFFRVVLY
jgi:hypothetical protein